MVFQHIGHKFLLVTVTAWKVCVHVWCWDRMCWAMGNMGCSWTLCLGLGSAWLGLGRVGLGIRCQKWSLQWCAGSLAAWWLGLGAYGLSDLVWFWGCSCSWPISHLCCLLLSLPWHTVCLFLGESLCHRNLGLIYQHKMRLITPLKCSASLVLQHQVLPQKTGEKEAQKFLVAVCLMCPHVGDKEDASPCGRSPNPLQRHCGQQRFASWWLHVRPSHMENKQKVKTTLSLDLVSSVSSCLTFMESSSSCLLPWMLFFFFL